MFEFFAESLTAGFFQSSVMGKGIVLVQIAGSVYMFANIIGKYMEIKGMISSSKRVMRDVMGERSVLDYYMKRLENKETILEKIYYSSCGRLLKLLAPDVRSLIIDRQPGAVAALTNHEMGLVKAICDHILDEQSIRVERGMASIETVIALAPMLGLLGTVWGVLDAFADMGAAGSATIATMAPAISSALVTTVVGLLIAIPGVMCHGWLSGKVRDIIADMEGFADDLMGRIANEFQGEGRDL